MIRRLVLLGLLGLTACPSLEEGPSGTVKGNLTPFRLQSSPTETARPALLRDVGLRRKLSQSIASALAAKQGTRSAGLATSEVRDDSIPGDVIVRFDEAHLPEAAALARVGLPGYRAVHKGQLTEHLHLIGYGPLTKRAMTLGETNDIARQVGRLSGVRYAEKNARVQAFKTPNDPGYSRQWHYPMMNLPAAWDVTTGVDETTKKPVVVAVLDSGIVKHPDLNNRILPGADLVADAAAAGDGNGLDTDPTDMGKDQPNGGSSWHGSHVAGTLGAESNEGKGVSGITWSGRNIVPVRVLGNGGGSFAEIAMGIQWAIGRNVPGLPINQNPAKVINMSLGGESNPSQALQEVIDDAVSRGVVIVVAAGNSDVDASRFSPCNQQNVICVGATRFSGRRASYSNYGTAVDVMATGGEVSEDLNGDGDPDGVLSTVLDDDGSPVWAYYQGTSMASPHVAGIAALMKSVNPGLTASQVEQILVATADTDSQCEEGCGAGLVNAQAAVLRAKGGLNPNAPAKLGVGSTQMSFPGSGTQQLFVRNLGGGTLRVTASAKGAQASSLSFPNGNTLSVSAYGSKQLAVAVKTAGLADGNYVAQVALTASNGNSSEVLVKFQVGGTSDKDAIIAFAYQDMLGEWQVDEEAVALVPASGNYAYSLQLSPRTYFALATIDEDGDNELFEDGERVGFWRDATNLEPIPLSESQTVSNVNFALVPYESDDGESTTSVIGQPCTSNSQCGAKGLCVTAANGYPGGYCTQDCIDTAICPAGSKCYYTNTSETAAHCFATCSGVGQGSCRSGYVCHDDGTGGGACDIP